MRIGEKSNRVRPYLAVLLLGTCLLGCSGLLSWVNGEDADQGEVAQAPINFPDLSQLPTPPGLPPSAETRGAMVQTLETARSRNQQAGENLKREIESNFEYPNSASN